MKLLHRPGFEPSTATGSSEPSGASLDVRKIRTAVLVSEIIIIYYHDFVIIVDIACYGSRPMEIYLLSSKI